MKRASDSIPVASTWNLIFFAGLVIFVFAVAFAQKPSASRFNGRHGRTWFPSAPIPNLRESAWSVSLLRPLAE